VHELAPKHPARLSWDGTSSSQYNSITRLLSNGSSDFRLSSYHARNSPFLLELLTHTIMRDVGDGTSVFLSIEIVRVPRFGGRYTERLGQLTQGHGRKDTLSRKTRCTIFMYIIFNPLTISSGLHFSRFALFRIK